MRDLRPKADNDKLTEIAILRQAQDRLGLAMTFWGGDWIHPRLTLSGPGGAPLS